MPHFPRWKIILVVAVCLLSVVGASPNVMPESVATWMTNNLPVIGRSVTLGLDLKGGSHLLLDVATDAVIEERRQSLLDQVRSDLRGGKIGYTDISLQDGAVRVKLSEAATADEAAGMVKKTDRELDVKTTGDILTVQMTEATIAAIKKSALDKSIEIVRRRIDEMGTKEPSIQRQGDSRILVQLPGVDDPGQIKRLLGKTAKLTFRLVDETASFAADKSAIPPVGTERLPSTDEDGRFWVVQKRVMVSGDMLVDAQASFQNGEPVVSFRFNAVGGKRFGETTRANVGRPFAIVLDNKIISAPVIREPILGGSGVISGKFSTKDAQELSLLLRAGALPAPINVIEERTVGPGLGTDSINAGAVASLVGLALVIVFFIIAYGLFGIFASISLLFTIALIFALLALFHATLTLPGIAGIVLTIGTALDANVLVFERIREEIRYGRSPISAINAGYDHSLSAIVDANMTTLIAAVILYFVGSGPVRGFAVTLVIGIGASIFTALLVTRLIVAFWFHRTREKLLPI